MAHVIYISMDGLRSGDPTRNLQTLIDNGLAPNFARLQSQGAWTFAARTDPLHTNTLPNHSTMVSGRPVEDASGAPGHRYRYNDDPEDVPTAGVPVPGVNLSTLHTSAGEYIPSVFNVVHDHGLSTAMYASKTKFSLYDASYDGVDTPGAAPYERIGLAQDTTGPDNGFDKIDRFFTGGVAQAIDRFVADAATFGLANYTFIHIASPDSAGHSSGWGSPEYLAAVRAADAQLGRVFALLDANPLLTADTFLIVSADHGGGGDEPVTDEQHGNPNSPLNFTIPFFITGPGVPAGADLYSLNDPRRDQPPADQNPSIIVAGSTGVQVPIRNGDSANLSLDLLGIDPIPTSAINSRQDLHVFGVPISYGTDAGETLSGDDGSNGIDGAGGDDTLFGLAGNDVLEGSLGNDRLNGGPGNDRLNGGGGTDTSSYAGAAAGVQVDLRLTRAQDTMGAGIDSLVGIENLLGSAFGDRLQGNADANMLDGGDGDDLLLTGGGGDVTRGGAGNDGVYVGAALAATVSNDGGAGDNDQLALQGNYSYTFRAADLVDFEALVLLSGTDSRFGDNAGNSYGYDLTTIDANVAAGQNLIVTANNLAAAERLAFNGSAERDATFRIFGGAGEEMLLGGGGSDGFLFRAGALTPGRDQVDGGVGADDQLGLRGDFSQLLAFEAATITNVDSIVLLSATDLRFGEAGSAFSYNLRTHDGNLAAGAQLTVNGNGLVAGETLTFDGSGELDGFFRLIGGAGADSLAGGAGNDVFFGGLGADQLTGNGGNDTFLYRAATESTAAVLDRISNFASGDKIDFSAIDAIAGGADDAFTFIGSAAFTAAGQVRAQKIGGIWTIEVNTDGTDGAEMVISATTQDPAFVFSGSDFML